MTDIRSGLANVLLCLMLTPAFGAASAGASGAREDARPSLLLVTIDTCRADHLSVYGYDRQTSPRLEELARRGVLFESMISPIPQTGPAHASLLTGRWPASLGLHDNATRLGPHPVLLSEVLAGRDYDTAAFVSGLTLVRRAAGLDRGFDRYDDAMPDARGAAPGVQRRGSKTTAAALAWLGSRDRDRPFFLWIHYYDPHGDYHPGGPFETMFANGETGPFLPAKNIPAYQREGHGTDAADYVARYDGELRYADTEIGKILDGLETLGLLPTTVVAVTGDHGENLVEHGYYFDHGNELYMEALHVPFLLAGPGVPAGRRVRGIVRIPDVMPTLLGLLGVQSLGEVEGQTLAGALVSSVVAPPREAFSEARLVPWAALTPIADVTPKLSVRDDRFTVLFRKATSKVELYDRERDPGESRNLFSSSSAKPEEEKLQASLRERMSAWLDAATAATRQVPVVITPELRRRLNRIAAEREPRR